MKSVDMKINYSVCSGQVALKPRVIGRNLAETQVFLCPTEERLSGVGVIQYLLAGKIPAVSNHGFKTPGNLESAILEEDWSTTMQTASQGLYADTHPEELISRVQSKLIFFNSFLTANSAAETGGVNLEHPDIADGVYWLLDGMACELGYALDKMMGVKP